MWLPELARGSKIKSGILGNGFELEILTHPVTIHIYVALYLVKKVTL